MTREDEGLAHIERIERRYHLFKAILIILVGATIILVMSYYASVGVDSVKQDNDNTRRLIRCIAPAFTSENYPNSSAIINQCLEATQDNGR